MDRELPNFDIFFNPQSNIKPTQQSSKSNQQKRQQESNSSYIQENHNNQNALHEIPESEYPTSQHPVLFYKIKDRLTSSMFTTRIGYRIRQFSRVEEDYICYLTQLLMTECTWLKIFIIEPNYLYFEISSISLEQNSEDNTRENERQEIVLENKILNILKSISEELINPWIDSELKPEKLTSEEFDEEKVIEKFETEVIEKVKEKYESVFNNSKNKHTKK